MTFCDQISDETKAEMEKMIRYTEETGNEHGIKLCLIDDKIVNSERCAGDKCSISAEAFDKISCPENSEYVSDFHTHPLEKGEEPEMRDIPSERDITRASVLSRSHTCVSSGKDNTYCYTIPKKNIDLACEMRQKSIDLWNIEEFMLARADEGADLKEVNLISDYMFAKGFEVKRAIKDLKDASTMYFFSPKMILDRCKVDLNSNANGKMKL